MTTDSDAREFAPENASSPTLRGRVIARASRFVTVEADGKLWECELRGKLRLGAESGQLVVGDIVDVVPDLPGRGSIQEVLERRNQLSRRRETGGGRELVLASNLDQVLAMCSVAEPRIKLGALDRLLVAAAANSLPAIILLNKIDLGLSGELREILQVYSEIGYPVRTISLAKGQGLDELINLLQNRITLVAGQSGVGKSSLLNRLIPGVRLPVGEISAYNEKGKHTTSAATWLALPGGGALIDTPGFREYALFAISGRNLAEHFPEFQAVGTPCRFADCSHCEEPGCAIRAAVEAGKINQRRYDSYRNMLREP